MRIPAFQHKLIYVLAFSLTGLLWVERVQAQDAGDADGAVDPFPLAEETAPFLLRLEPVAWSGLPGLQSYAWAQHGVDYLFIGGRLDGLHRRQPWASFDSDGFNRRIYVVNASEGLVWSRSLEELGGDWMARLSVSNPCFRQDGRYLYLAGGYGRSAATDEPLTFPYFTQIDVPGLIHAVRSGKPMGPHLLSVREENMAVTGGHLARIGDVWMLVAGQRFDGFYNPMGHPTHVQQYTNAVRRFRLPSAGASLAVEWLEPFRDTALLHRRDYNLLPSLAPDGTEAWTIYSGVFRPDIDQPFLDVVDLGADGISQRKNFSQQFQQYHSARMALHSKQSGDLHHLFFGGIAQYQRDAGGLLIQDTDVPFVRTIARVTRDAMGRTAEYALPLEMPMFIGAAAELLPAPELPLLTHGIVDLDSLTSGHSGDSILLGFLVGGIHSDAGNIFWTSEGEQSRASATVYRVWLKIPAAGEGGMPPDKRNPGSEDNLQIQVYPIADDGAVHAALMLWETEQVALRVFSPEGALLAQHEANSYPSGRTVISLYPAEQPLPMVILEWKAGLREGVQLVRTAP